MALNVGELYASFGIDTKGLDKQISGIQKQCQSIGKGMALAGAGLTAAITAPLVKAGKAIFSAGAGFESQMSKVQAILGDRGTAEAMKELTEKAMQMGDTSRFNATEAGQALEYMAMAGWKDEAMLAGLEPIMNLAAAAGADLGTTSDIVTDAMTAMGYTLDSVGGDAEAFNKQITHFTDVLAAAATSSNTNVTIMGESFKYVAPLAGTLGYSIDDVAVALGTMANAGIKGSQAGTSLRNILNNMIKPTKDQSKALKRLGLSLTDSNGKTKSFGEIMGDMRKVAKESGIDMQALQKSVGELDEKLANGEITEKQYNKEIKKLTKGNAQFLKDVSEIAGTRGLSGMLAIMNATDEEFEELTKSILGCDGAAAKMAATMMDNVQGDVDKFKNTMHGLGIVLFNDVAPSLREIVQSATEMAAAFRDISPEIRKGSLKMLLLAAAAGPAMAALGGIVSFLPQIGAALAGLASPLGIVTIGLGLFAAAAISTDNDVGRAFENMATSAAAKLNDMDKTIGETMQGISDKMPAVIESVTNGLGELIPAAVRLGLDVITGFMDSISDNADGIVGVSSTIITSFLQGVSDRLDDLIPAAAEMVTQIGIGLINHAPDILSAAGEVGLSIIEGILDTDWLGLAGQLVDAIGKALGKMDENATTFGDKIGRLINDQLTPEKIGTFFTNAGEVAVKLIGLIADGIVGATTHASELITAIGGAISGALEGDLLGDLSGVGVSIINALASAILAAANGAATLIDTIGQLISNALNGGTIGNLGGFGEAIITAIVNAVKAIGTGGIRILYAIGNALASVDFNKVGSSLVSLGSGLVSALVNAVSSEDFSSVMIGIAGGLGKVTGELATAALQIVGQLINYMLNPANWIPLGRGIVTILGSIFKGIFAFVDEFTGGLLTDTTEEKLERLAGAAETVDEFGEAAEGVRKAGQAFDEAGRSLTELQEFSQADYEKVTSDLLNLSKADLEGIGTGILDTMNALGEGGKTSEEIDALRNSLLQYQAVLDLIMQSGISGNENTGKYDLMQLIGFTGLDMDKLEGTSDEIYAALSEAIAEALSETPVPAEVPIEPEPKVESPVAGPTDAEWLSQMTDYVDAAGLVYDVPTVEEDLSDVSVTTTGDSGLQTATQGKIDQLIAQQKFTASVDVETAVNVTITDSNGFAVGQQVGESIKRGAASGVVGGASMAFTAGANFAKGYANGINSQISAIANNAAEMVRAAIRAANEAQNSGSPSRVMEQVGNWYGQGYVRGIVNQIRYVKKAAGGMADSAVNALTMRSNATPALAMAGNANARDSMDYDRLAYAMSQRPAPVLDLNGKRVAEINSNNTAVAQNSRSRNIATRYGSR